MIRALATAAVLLLASLAFAEAPQTVLTPDGVLYAIQADGDLPLLQVTRRSSAHTSVVIVPSTEDEAIETHPRLVFDTVAKSLIVVWHRAGEEGDDIRLVTLAGDGTWSEPMTISGCNTARRAGLQVVLTHLPAEVEGGLQPTLVHIAWWKLNEIEQIPEYALVAFEDGKHVSTDVENLQDLAGVRQSGNEGGELEDVAEALHPPLAVARTGRGDEVEVVFGTPGSTALTRVKLLPKLVAGQARLWKPSRGSGGGLPKAGLVSSDGAPVRSFLSNGRVVLYTPDEQFRYVVYENGAWTPTRMIKVDESLTPDEILEHLRKAIDAEEVATDEDGGATNE
jgi:hypothetical protein